MCTPEGVMGQVFAYELVGTFIYVTAFMYIRNSVYKDYLVKSGAIGLSLFGVSVMIFDETSACLNPMVGFT